MAKLQKVSMRFLKMPIESKPGFGMHVATALIANASIFPAPPHPIAALQAANSTLETALANYQSRSRVDKDHRDTAVREWNALFSDVADYVSATAAGDVELIELPGFKATRGGHHKRQPPQDAQGGSAKPGAEGEAKLKVAAQKDALAYLYLALPEGAQVIYLKDGTARITMPGGELLFVKSSTRSRTSLTELPSGKRLHISIQPVNAAGHGHAASGMAVIPQ